MSFEKQFAEIHPAKYADLKSDPTCKSFGEEEWKKLLAIEWTESKVYLTRTQKYFFEKVLRNSNTPELKRVMGKILEMPSFELSEFFGSCAFLQYANPFCPAQSYMTPEIRHELWIIISNFASSADEKVRWAIRTYQPIEIIAGILQPFKDVAHMQAPPFDLLHEACLYSQLPTVRLLLSKKANPNALDEQGLLPLEYAATNNDMKVVRLLLNAQPDLKTILSTLCILADAYFVEIRRCLIGYLNENYKKDYPLFESSRGQLPGFLSLYPLAFILLQRHIEEFPCKEIHDALRLLRFPPVSLSEMNVWWQNLGMYKSDVFSKNPRLLEPPPVRADRITPPPAMKKARY